MAESASGMLDIEINASNPSDPIEGVKVTITEHDNRSVVIKVLETDANGQIRDIELPAGQASHPNALPYRKYDLLIDIPPAGQRAESAYRYIKSGVQIYPGETTNSRDELTYILKLEEAVSDRSFEIGMPDSVAAEGDPAAVYQNPDQFPDRLNEQVHGFMPVYIQPFVPGYIDIFLGVVNPYIAYKPVNKRKVIQDDYKSYLKRVAAIEIGGIPQLADEAIIANILAINSFALNRIYTEVYADKGYPFHITYSTAFDQHYPPAYATLQRIDAIVDKYFDKYIRAKGMVQPFFSQYCAKWPCQNKGMGQHKSNQLARDGMKHLDILKFFYEKGGREIEIVEAAQVELIKESYPGYELKKGMEDRAIGALKKYLNLIRKSYTSIPKLDEADNRFDARTEQAVTEFQRIAGKQRPLVKGIVDRDTWRLLSEKYFFLGGGH